MLGLYLDMIHNQLSPQFVNVCLLLFRFLMFSCHHFTISCFHFCGFNLMFPGCGSCMFYDDFWDNNSKANHILSDVKRQADCSLTIFSYFNETQESTYTKLKFNYHSNLYQPIIFLAWYQRWFINNFCRRFGYIRFGYIRLGYRRDDFDRRLRR